MGDVTDDGTTYIVWRTNWDSMLRIDLATQEFTVVPVDVAEMGASVGGGSSIQVSPDFAISAQNGLAYTVDYINDNLYAIDTATGTVTQSDLIYLGAKPTPDANGKLQAGGMIIDDAISLYTITNGGNHDSDHNGTLDVVGRSVVYRVNVATSEVEYLVATNETSLQGNDAAGCFEAVDYGDALSTYGTVSHAYLDVALDGKADLTLGDSWDPEFNSWFSLDAKGDDSHGRDDETLNLPTTIIVDNSTNLPIEVTGSGFINIWADLNNDGDFADSNEHIVSDQAVSNGNNDISVNLNSSAAQGFSGDTVMRIRLCSALSSCNTPSGSAADGEVEDHLFELINHILLSGIVFDDNGLGNATLAHNGIQDGNEIGIGDVMLTLTLNDVAVNGFNTGDIIKSVTTAGNGAYQFNLDIDFSDKNIILSTVEQATWIDISEANVTSIPQVTSASVTDGTMSVTASAGNNLTGLNFGKVASPTFDTDNFTEIEPGTFVLFRHKFTALTSGVVVFNIDLNNGLPNNWTVNLFEDINCNGQIDGMDAPLTPINVDINTRSEVCLTAKVVVPADAKINQTLSYDIVADMTFADDANTNHGITRTPTNTDSTRATYDGAGTLALNKTVRNITQGGGVTTTNFAKPGDILEYVISFTNSGSGDISNVVLFDTIPPFTKLNTAVTCGSAIPTNNSCTVESPSTNNSAGYQGDIRWKLNSTLAAGESGTVSYQVKVD
ncbi:GEVED domain-containing protein [Shewanella marina]|uniref:GEVED domain-containing protein n=1 Tax=Shewanella marina TaxID=487319 RepID=UPI0006846F81|nr:GEVED domain-containing protein [Shewanella marina]